MNSGTRTIAPGTVIDNRYEVVKTLGRGGFASVYLAHHLQLDRDVALKILDPIAFGTLENFLQRFMSEARIVANIRHPNVVMIYDFGVVRDDQPYLAMEYLEGRDLEEELNLNGPMAPMRSRGLFLGVLDALQAGHDKQVVHKDLKPSNLFLAHPGTAQEKLMVLDYGIARIADSDSPRLTKTGGYTGTPAYMPPEYVQHSIVAPTNDVYQLALILAETLTGKQVVNAKTSVAYMVAHMSGEHHIDPWLDNSEWGHVIRHALTVDHTQRYQNAGEFRRALSAAGVPNISAEIDPVGHTVAGSISSQMLGAPESNASIEPNQTGPAAGKVPERVQKTPMKAVAQLPVVAATQPGKPGALETTNQPPPNQTPRIEQMRGASSVGQNRATDVDPVPPAYAQQTPAIPGQTPGHAPRQAPTHAEGPFVPQPSAVQPPQPAPPQYGYGHYQPKKKSRWPLGCFLTFLFICFAIVASPVAVIWGYYGGWDEYIDSWEAYATDQIDDVVPDFPKIETPGFDPKTFDPKTFDPIKYANQMAPNAEVRKIAILQRARYMIFHTIHFVKLYETEAEKNGYAKRPSYLPSDPSMLQIGLDQLSSSKDLDGGSSKLTQSVTALAEDTKQFMTALSELIDYYDLDQGHLQDGGARGKILGKAVHSSFGQLEKSFRKFHKQVELQYTDHFTKCSDTSDKFMSTTCKLMLSAQKLSLATMGKNKKFSPEIKQFTTAYKNYNQVVKSGGSKLKGRYPHGQIESLADNARDLLEEAREVARDQDAPFFVFMARNSMLNDYEGLLR